MSGAPMQRVLITGSNKGLGLGLCSAYAERGDQVVAACRLSSPELDALGVTVLDGVELSSDEAVQSLARRIDGDIDVLVCNAGINTDSPGLDDIEVKRLAEMYDINALGSVRVVLALLPHLRAGSKIVFVSSMGLLPLGILNTRTVGNYGYRMSKAALVSFAHALAHDVRDRGISVAITSPGRVDTSMLRDVLAEGRTTQAAVDEAVDPLTAARMLCDRVDALTLDDSPAFHRDPQGNPAIPPSVLLDLQEANIAQTAQGAQMLEATS